MINGTKKKIKLVSDDTEGKPEKAGTVVTNATFEPFTVYGFVALIYFALCWPLSKTSQVLERKLHVPHFNH